MVSFYLKPRRRLWDPDGIDSLIEITVPKIVDIQRTKGISQNEADRRFSYLAEIVDSHGWAVRGRGVQAPNNAINSDVYFEAQQVQDILDNDSIMTQAFDNKLEQVDARKHQEMINLVQGQATVPQPALSSFSYFSNSLTEPYTAPEPIMDEQLKYNPYSEDIQQSVLQPITTTPISRRSVIDPIKPVVEPSPTTSEKIVSAGIINLASNTDLSIEAIAREANRIQEKQGLSGEVVISLR